jgi:hypothetical protein
LTREELVELLNQAVNGRWSFEYGTSLECRFRTPKRIVFDGVLFTR